MSRSSNLLKNSSLTNSLKFASIFISFSLSILLTACSTKNDLVAPQTTSETVTTNSIQAINQLSGNQIDTTSTLKALASFPIGAAFNSAIVKNNDKASRLFYNQFDAKTVHAYMNTEPAQGNFNFTEMDYWVKATENQSIRLHGHCLVYHVGAPEWLQSFNGTTTAFEAVIKNHIQTVVGRYKGKMASWDVINEIYDYNTGTIRQTAFRKLYKSDADYLEFVKRCFQWAHEADPNAKLFYNDFGMETSSSKLEAIVKMVNNFKQSGVPINGIGTQMHIDVTTSNDGIRNAFQRLASTGLMVHVSELDITVNTNNDATMVFTKQIQDTQASKYQTVASLFKLNVPAQLQYGITLWSFSDADSWLVVDKKQRDMPNVFDASFNKKIAFFGLLAGLKN